MATIQSITAARAQEIEDASVVSGYVNGSGHLILTTAGGTTYDAGVVVDSSGVITHAALITGVHGVGSGEIVGTTLSQVLSNKTLVNPTIGSFVNADHNHSDAANGGDIVVFSGVKAIRTVSQLIADSAFELVAFSGTSAYDTDSFKTNSTTYTIPAGGSGYYDILAQVPWEASANNRRSIDIRLNDSSTNSTAGTSIGKTVLSPGHNATCPIQVSAKAYLSAGDYIKVGVWQNSGGGLNILGTGSDYSTFLAINRMP
jgi:hypothetical protein